MLGDQESRKAPCVKALIDTQDQKEGPHLVLAFGVFRDHFRRNDCRRSSSSFHYLD